MNQASTPPALPGTVSSRLSEVIGRAQAQWHTGLTQRALARATGLQPRSIALLVQDRAQSYSFRTLAPLCWFFGCDVGALLVHRAPSTAEVPAFRIRATMPPVTHPVTYGVIHSHIAAHLTLHPLADIVHHTGLSADEVRLLQQRPPQRIYRPTLAALCTFLRTDVDALLHYVPCMDAQDRGV